MTHPRRCGVLLVVAGITGAGCAPQDAARVGDGTWAVRTGGLARGSTAGEAPTAWWRDVAGGVEQGWSIETRVPGAGPLVLDVVVDGPGSTIVRPTTAWLRDGESTVRVSGLAAWDADGAALPARFVARAGGFGIEVDDAAGRYPITVDPIYEAASLTFVGGQDSPQPDYFGVTLSHGDVNGDGYIDILISASQADGEAPSDFTGKAYVYNGSAAGYPEEPSTTLVGAGFDERFGMSSAILGDVNGDGFDDVAVGAPTDTSTGRVDVFYGSAAGLETNPAIEFVGEAADDYLFPVARAGDVNGDGFADLLIGEAGYDDYTGRTLLFFGSAAGFGAEPNQTWTGDAPGGYFGASMAGNVDFNADGYGDIVIGDPFWNGNVGRFHVYMGSAAGASATPDLTVEGDGVAQAMANSMAGAGDVDGDGYDDLLVGATIDAQLRGHVYLFTGSAAGLGASPQSTIVGPDKNSLMGLAMSRAGDVNRDGYADVLLGATSAGDVSGRAYLFEGGPSGIAADPTSTLSGVAPYDYFGTSVAAAGDVDADGYDDVMVSNPGQSTVTVYSGYADGSDTGDSGGTGDSGDTAIEDSGTDSGDSDVIDDTSDTGGVDDTGAKDSGGRADTGAGGGGVCGCDGSVAPASAVWSLAGGIVVLRRRR